MNGVCKGCEPGTPGRTFMVEKRMPDSVCCTTSGRGSVPSCRRCQFHFPVMSLGHLAILTLAGWLGAECEATTQPAIPHALVLTATHAQPERQQLQVTLQLVTETLPDVLDHVIQMEGMRHFITHMPGSLSDALM